jgi:hypothetical protein
VHGPVVADARPAVIILAGVHAREYLPPDATVGFIQKLLAAYVANQDIVYTPFRDAGANYPQYVIAAGDVQAIVNELDTYFVPLVNPDGRDFALGTDWMWRKNRRRVPGKGIGVDNNRNYDISWDYEEYFKQRVKGDLQVSKDWGSECFYGTSAASEAETQDVQKLIKDVVFRGGPYGTYFMDIHSYGRKIEYPWNIDQNQALRPKMNFMNPDWNRRGKYHGRDGIGGPYGEFNYLSFTTKEESVGNAMKDEILKTGDPAHRDRSMYDVIESTEASLPDGILITGAGDDFTFSQQYRTPNTPQVIAFTLECGSQEDGEGGFHPPFNNKFRKIEREVHAAIFRLMRTAVP